MSVRYENGKWIAYCDKCGWEAMWPFTHRVYASGEYVAHVEEDPSQKHGKKVKR